MFFYCIIFLYFCEGKILYLTRGMGGKWFFTHFSKIFLQVLVFMKNMFIPKKTAVYNKDH